MKSHILTNHLNKFATGLWSTLPVTSRGFGKGSEICPRTFTDWMQLLLHCWRHWYYS